VSDFDDQKASAGEVAWRLCEDAAHQIQPVAPAGKRESRLAPVFPRKSPHRSFSHVRGIAQDQVVAAAGERSKEIRLDELYATLQPIRRDVAPCHIERWAGNVDRVDVCTPEFERGENCQATGAGAQIEDASDRRLGSKPGREPLAEQFRDVRARNDHSLIDIEPMFAKPGFVREIGGGFSRPYAFFDERPRGAHLRGTDRPVEIEHAGVRRQSQRMKDEPCGFVARVCRAMAVGEPGRVELPRSFAQKFAQRGYGRVPALSRAHPD